MSDDLSPNKTPVRDNSQTEYGRSRTKLAKNASMIIIPGEIFAETINILGKKFGHARALQTAQTLLKSPDFLVIDTEELTRLNALELFQTTPAGVSFTDCLVMATADKYETREIFGFDRIFSTKGYNLPGQLREAA